MFEEVIASIHRLMGSHIRSLHPVFYLFIFKTILQMYQIRTITTAVMYLYIHSPFIHLYSLHPPLTFVSNTKYRSTPCSCWRHRDRRVGGARGEKPRSRSRSRSTSYREITSLNLCPSGVCCSN